MNAKDVTKKAALTSGASSVVPVAAVGLGALLAYNLLSGDDEDGGGFSGSGSSYFDRLIQDTIVERINNNTESIIDNSKIITETIIDAGEDVLDAGNENPILRFITPDIQRKEDYSPEMTKALEDYTAGNVSVETITAGKMSNDDSFFDMFLKAWSPESLAKTEWAGFTPLSFLDDESKTGESVTVFDNVTNQSAAPASVSGGITRGVDEFEQVFRIENGRKIISAAETSKYRKKSSNPPRDYAKEEEDYKSGKSKDASWKIAKINKRY